VKRPEREVGDHDRHREQDALLRVPLDELFAGGDERAQGEGPEIVEDQQDPILVGQFGAKLFGVHGGFIALAPTCVKTTPERLL
jgi:hypothetical protein